MYKNKEQPKGITDNTERANFWYTKALEDSDTKRKLKSIWALFASQANNMMHKMLG